MSRIMSTMVPSGSLGPVFASSLRFSSVLWSSSLLTSSSRAFLTSALMFIPNSSDLVLSSLLTLAETVMSLLMGIPSGITDETLISITVKLCLTSGKVVFGG